MQEQRFSKDYINDLDYSLEKEYLISSTSGVYSSATIAGCNTRKYHGLLIAPQPSIDDDNHVLLSSLDETVTYKGHSYGLGIHQYPNTIYPQGYKYVEEAFVNPLPGCTYRLGDALLSKEILLSAKDDTLFIRYTLPEASEPVLLNLLPLIAFRNVHALVKANLKINKKLELIPNGIMIKPYSGYDSLFMQFSSKTEFIPVPDWYYTIEYEKERERGYDYHEDLY